METSKTTSSRRCYLVCSLSLLSYFPQVSRAMSEDDIAHMLNLRGVDCESLADVISDYFGDDYPEEDVD